MAEDKSRQGGADQDMAEIKSRIVEAASKLYEKKGQHATVEDIASAAGVSVPVTYQFVKKPADIMLLIMETLQQQFAEGLAEFDETGASPRKKLVAAFRQFLKVVDQQAPKVLLVYRYSRTLDKLGLKRVMELELAIQQKFKSILEEGIGAAEFSVLDSDLAAYDLVMMGHLWALKQWHFKKIGLSFSDFLARQESAMLTMILK
ncbi:MAG: TetR/AcrR family transcriptional regulator [Deltaproteobacteria bacterium]|nr:TetR/AcrR family transcriptional regulator [Deltaproteobacteria bacterium]